MKAPKSMGSQKGVNRDSEEGRTKHLAEMIDQLNQLHDGTFELADNLPLDLQEAHLEHVLAFESVSSGASLFQGLEQHGVKLPRPETIDETQCIEKITEVFHALADLGVLLIGFEHMGPKEFYATLWNQTLWEGCYLEKRAPGALTIIDVSHSMSRADWHRFMEGLSGSHAVQ